MNAALQAEWGHIRNTARFSQDHQCREPMKCTTEVIVDERSEFALISVTGPIDRSRTPYLVSLRQKRSRNPQVSPSETPPGCKSLYPQRSVVRIHKILMFVPQSVGYALWPRSHSRGGPCGVRTRSGIRNSQTACTPYIVHKSG
jgi:hypothetical protein